MTIFQEASRPGLFPPLVEGMAVMRMGINLECGLPGRQVLAVRRQGMGLRVSTADAC